MTQQMLTKIVLATRPTGRPRPDNFRLEQAVLPDVPQGGLLLRTLYLSLDPYMRGRMDDRPSYVPPIAIDAVMGGETVSEVIASDRADYSVGDIVLAPSGWSSHAAWVGDSLRKLDPSIAPITTGLGVLGMPGFTAYAGLNIIGKPKPGETLVVAAASGPVGSLVGQLAHQAGLRTVGIAGGLEKCRYLIDELGFDAAIDHRNDNLRGQLASACPKGIDIYFENVGGAVWQAVRPLLNRFARVPVCGLIAQYNGGGPADDVSHTMRAILTKSLTVRGFINYEFAADHYADFLTSVSKAIADGKIRYREDIVEGLAAAPEAFIGMLDGKNFGKLLVKVS